MVDLRSKMFKESSDSYASPNLFIKLLVFISAFAIIFILEAVVPSVITIPKMMEELSKDPEFVDGAKKFTFDESMEMTKKFTNLPEIMIPTLLSTVFGTLISLFCCRCIEMRPVRSMGLRKGKVIPHYLTGLLVGGVMMTAITLLTVLSGANSIKLCSGINAGVIALYFCGFFIQGMSEEFIFRGYLMTSIGGHHSPLLAIAINSAAFGLAHIGNPGMGVLPMINLVLFGAFASLYMICFEDIWGVSAIHSIWNFMQGNIYGISVSGSGDSESVFRVASASNRSFLTGGEFGIEGSIFTTVVLLAATAFVIRKISNRKAELDDDK